MTATLPTQGHFAAMESWLEKHGGRSEPNPCIRWFGRGPEGKTCAKCARLYRKTYSKTYYKCMERGNTNGPGTDHRCRWKACAKYTEVSPSAGEPAPCGRRDTPSSQPDGKPAESFELKQGDRVNYHAVIGGPATSFNHKIVVMATVGRQRVAWITRHVGCVALDALTLAREALA